MDNVTGRLLSIALRNFMRVLSKSVKLLDRFVFVSNLRLLAGQSRDHSDTADHTAVAHILLEHHW